jgi:hypothetical protein
MPLLGRATLTLDGRYGYTMPLTGFRLGTTPLSPDRIGTCPPQRRLRESNPPPIRSLA